jgi:deazaflavin-dependent oxidoreductase (nitroreductase family)
MSTNDAMRDFNQNLMDDFRANGGRATSGPFANVPLPLLLLTTRGARTGEERTTPLVYTTDGDRYVIIASKGGAPTHPAWYHNLLANPRVTLEVGDEKFEAEASVVSDSAERDRLYDAQAALMPNFAEYQRNTTRRIPVVVLERQ